MKECNLDCYCQHEGFCTLKEMYNINPNVCKAKTDDDLREYDEDLQEMII